MATHSSILAWEIPWTEEPEGYSLWGGKESDATEQAHTHALNTYYSPALYSTLGVQRYIGHLPQRSRKSRRQANKTPDTAFKTMMLGVSSLSTGTLLSLAENVCSQSICRWIREARVVFCT